jgi:hypothetical protein
VVSIEDVASALDRIDFPVDKNECIIHAVRHDATRDVIDALNRIPDKTYHSIDGVWNAVEKTKRA